MDRLDVHPRVVTALNNVKLHDFGTILSMSAPDLQRATQLSASDVTTLHQAVAKTVRTLPPVTGLQLLRGDCPSELQTKWLSMGCPVLNEFIKGGILSNGITEISGESASGKTQLCMQLCLTVQLKPGHGGLGKGAAYICTEDVFPNKRLMQMANQFLTQNKTKMAHARPTDYVFIEHASDVNDLSQCLRRKVPLLLGQGRVGLLIIDSITAVFRGEYGLQDMQQRAKQLTSIGAQLHNISNKYNVPIVCINQVSDVMSTSNSMPGTRKVLPALGIAWANLVTTRLMLARTRQTVTYRTQQGHALEANVRTMEVMFAPHLPNSLCYFVVTDQGVNGLS